MNCAALNNGHYPNHTHSLIYLVDLMIKPVLVAPPPLFDTNLLFFHFRWLTSFRLQEMSCNSLTQIGIPYGSRSDCNWYWNDSTRHDATHFSVSLRPVVMCCFHYLRSFLYWLQKGRILWRGYWSEKRIMIFRFSNNSCFVRTYFVQPVYLGCAAQKMSEDNIMVWYGTGKWNYTGDDLSTATDRLIKQVFFKFEPNLLINPSI